MKKLFLPVAALILVVIAVPSLEKETRHSLKSAMSVSGLLDGGRGGGVVIVFQPEDCFADGTTVRRWKRLHESGMFNVVGRVVGDGKLSALQREIFDEEGLHMSVESISVEDVAVVGEKLGYGRTPFGVIVDSSGRVLGSFPGQQNVPPEIVRKILGGEGWR